jgi:hypothetical protein
MSRRSRAMGLGLLAALAVASASDVAAARGSGGHGIHRIFPGTYAAGAGSAARIERARACRVAWQASLTPERPSYVPYASFRRAHCAKGQTPHPAPPPAVAGSPARLRAGSHDEPLPARGPQASARAGMDVASR